MMHTAKYASNFKITLPAYDELFEEISLDGLVENKGTIYE